MEWIAQIGAMVGSGGLIIITQALLKARKEKAERKDAKEAKEDAPTNMLIKFLQRQNDEAEERLQEQQDKYNSLHEMQMQILTKQISELQLELTAVKEELNKVSTELSRRNNEKAKLILENTKLIERNQVLHNKISKLNL